MASQRIRIPLPDLTKSEKTYLSADYVASSSYLTVVNNRGFSQYDYVVVGEPGEEKTEFQDVTGTTGNTQVDISSALKFDHNKDCVVYRAEYNQVEIYRIRAGTITLISTSNIQWDRRETIYVDTSSTSVDYYKFRLKNSVASRYSDYSPTIPATGIPSNRAGYVISRVRKIVGDNDRRLFSDAELFQQFNDLRDRIQNMRHDWWFLLVDTYKASNGIATVDGTDTYSLATYTDLNFVSTVRYKYYDGTTTNVYHLKQEPKLLVEYDHRDVDTNNEDDWVTKYCLLPPDSSSDQGYIRVWPTPETTNYGTFYPDYYKKMTAVDDVMDEVEAPLVSLFLNCGCAFGFRVKGDETKAKIYDAYVTQGLKNLELLNNNQKKAVGQPKSLKTFAGRKAMGRLYGDHIIDRDSYAERWF